MRVLILAIGIAVTLSETAFGQPGADEFFKAKRAFCNTKIVEQNIAAGFEAEKFFQSCFDSKEAEAAAGEVQPRTPSFDCAKARSASARLICSDSILSTADAELGNAFRASSSKLEGQAKQAAVQAQIAWIRERNSKCGLGVDKLNIPIEQLAEAKPCLATAIKERIYYFTGPPAENARVTSKIKRPEAGISLTQAEVRIDTLTPITAEEAPRLRGVSSSSATFTPDRVGTYTLSLTATAPGGAAGTDLVDVRVDPPPIVRVDTNAQQGDAHGVLQARRVQA